MCGTRRTCFGNYCDSNLVSKIENVLVAKDDRTSQSLQHSACGSQSCIHSDVHMELSIFNIFRVFLDRVITATIHNIPSNIFSLHNVVGRVCNAWYIWKVWRWTLGQRRVTALHQELTVVDYACTPRGGREERAPGSCTIIRRQLRLIRKGHSANWNDFIVRLFDG